MNKVFYLLVFCVTISISCTDRKINLNKLPYEVKTYEDLPEEIKEFLANWQDYNLRRSSIVCLDDSFKIEIIETWYGPWLSHYLLIDSSGKKIKIDPPQSTPFITFDSGLYICNSYNYLKYSKVNKEVVFVRYNLE